MIKLLLTLILVFAIAGIGFFLQRYDFPITAEMQGYYIETSSTRLVMVLVFLFAITYAVLKLFFWFKNSPRRLLSKMRKEHESQGYRNIMRGFSALAAGDAGRARKFAGKSGKALPHEPLVKLLQAQIAVNAGEKEAAAGFYRELTLSEDGKFAGFRGLVSQSMQANEPEKALAIAGELLRDNPKSSWLNEALIDLAFRIPDWDKLERYLKKAEANRSLGKVLLNEKFAIYYHVKAKIALSEGRVEDAKWLGERSLKYKGDFLPPAILLSGVYNDEGNYKKTRKLVAKFWGVAPHPILARNYEHALLNSGIREKAGKVKRLYEKNPDDIESIEFYARVLIDEKQADVARDILQKGLRIRETRGLCILMARIDDKVAWESRGVGALEDKCWHCRVTGARYAEWQVYSDSGEINTIEWGFAEMRLALTKSALAHSDFLSIR